MNRNTWLLGAAYGLTLVGRAMADGSKEEDKEENVGLAVALSLGAGLSTAIGGAAPFFPALRKISSAKLLAGSLAVASGVMLYISFVEIIFKGNDSLTLGLGKGTKDAEGEELGYVFSGDKHANLYTTLSFFCGCIIVMLLHKLVHCISPVTAKLDIPTTADGRPQAGGTEPVDEEDAKADEETGKPTTPASKHSAGSPTEEGNEKHKEDKELKKLGMLTALAIALHNFPEGFGSFIATLEEPSLGAGLAIGLAIHNIPEGICVAMPVYYATGSKWKGFGWALLSGVSEPIGGILGWLALRSVLTDTVVGVVFAIVSGMMVWVVISELLPVAFHHDPKNEVVPPCFFGGMVLISVSLIIFGFA